MSDEAGRERSSGRGVRLTLGLLLAAAMLYAAVGWYVSGEIIAGMVVDQHEATTIDVLEITEDEVVLDVTGTEQIEADRDAVMGLEWDGGYGQVGPAAEPTGGEQTRPFSLLEGDPPPVGDALAELDTYAFPDDPSSLGVEFEAVTYPAELGELEA